jgi:cell division septum initiation protein DivIVA
MSSIAVELLDKLYDMVQDAFSLPFGADRCVLDRDSVLGLLDEIRHTLPEDLKQAQTIVESRNEVLQSAKKEADATKRQAEEHARKMVSQEEILNSARSKANNMVADADRKSREMVAEAEQRSREIRKAASDFLDNALKKTEEIISYSLGDVKKARSEFKSAMAKMKSTES